MPGSMRFARSCPTCGRTLEIRVSLIGRTVLCQHCGAEFKASMSDSRAIENDQLLDAKIDQLLYAADQHLARFTPQFFSPNSSFEP